MSSRLVQSFYTQVPTTRGGRWGTMRAPLGGFNDQKIFNPPGLFLTCKPLQPSVLLTQVFTTVGVVQHKSHSGSPNCMNYTAVKSSWVWTVKQHEEALQQIKIPWREVGGALLLSFFFFFFYLLECGWIREQCQTGEIQAGKINEGLGKKTVCVVPSPAVRPNDLWIKY